MQCVYKGEGGFGNHCMSCEIETGITIWTLHGMLNLDAGRLFQQIIF